MSNSSWPRRERREPATGAEAPHAPDWLTRRTGNFLGLLACAALIGYALYAQYGMGLEPCPLCILQRVAVMAAGVLFLLAALHNPGDRGARVYGALIDLVALPAFSSRPATSGSSPSRPERWRRAARASTT